MTWQIYSTYQQLNWIWCIIGDLDFLLTSMGLDQQKKKILNEVFKSREDHLISLTLHVKSINKRGGNFGI